MRSVLKVYSAGVLSLQITTGWNMHPAFFIHSKLFVCIGTSKCTQITKRIIHAVFIYDLIWFAHKKRIAFMFCWISKGNTFCISNLTSFHIECILIQFDDLMAPIFFKLKNPYLLTHIHWTCHGCFIQFPRRSIVFSPFMELLSKNDADKSDKCFDYSCWMKQVLSRYVWYSM